MVLWDGQLIWLTSNQTDKGKKERHKLTISIIRKGT